MTPLTITITQEDIDEGRKYYHKKPSTEFCPTALAIKRAVGHDVVWVGYSYFGIGDTDYRLPKEVEMWIRDYESYGMHDKVEPITFEVDGVPA